MVMDKKKTNVKTQNRGEESYKNGNGAEEHAQDPIENPLQNPVEESLTDPIKTLLVDPLGDIGSDGFPSAAETPKSIPSTTASVESVKSSKTVSKQLKKSGQTSARKNIRNRVASLNALQKSEKSEKTSTPKNKTDGDADNLSIGSNASTKSTKSTLRSSVTSLQFGSLEKNISSPATPQSRSLSHRSSKGSIVSGAMRLHSSRQSANVEAKMFNTNQSTKEAETKPKKKFRDILHSDDGSLTDPEEWSELQSEVPEEEEVIMRINILEHLKELPDIDNLSERSSDSAQVKAVDEIDKGHFVPPLYGSSASEVSSVKFKAMSLEIEPEEESSFEDASTTSGSVKVTLDTFSDSNNELFAVKTNIDADNEGAEDVASKLIKITICDNQMQAYDPTDEYSVAQRRALEEACEQLLDELLQRVMIHSEEEPRRLRRLLDKEKLMKELIQLVRQHDDENSMRKMLSQSVTEHFLRKKQFVFIKKETHFDDLNFQRFRSSLIELDRLLEVETKTVEQVQDQITTLTEEYNRSQNYCEQKAREFEEIVRKTLLINDNFLHLPDVVDNMFKNMSRFRNELSELRLKLLHIQHRFAEMKIRSEKLEDLGDGLKMQEYLSKQTHTHVLLSKIADRDADLNRLHAKLNYDLHALAHLRGKEQMCRKSLEAMKLKLKECETLRKHYRDLIYKGKLKHNKFLRELHRMGTKGTLIFYPTLMIDYDQTAQLLVSKREAVGKLRLEHKHLTDRIAKMEMELLAERRKDKLSRSFIIRQNLLPGLTVTQLYS